MAKKFTAALEMPEDETGAPEPTATEKPAPQASEPRTIAERQLAQDLEVYPAPQQILLPPIPSGPVRRIMVQLSIKAPIELVDRLEGMTKKTGAQKQAIIAAALEAYMRGHGY